MIIHWGYLLAGLFFTFLPGQLLRGSNCRNFDGEKFHQRLMDKNRRQRRWWKLPAVWIEPVRGYIAVSMLSSAFEALPESEGFAHKLPYLAAMLILSIGITIQCQGSREKRVTIAPAGYLAGLMLAWLPLGVGIPAIILAGSTAIAFRRWEAGFIAGSMGILVIGYFYMGPSISLLWATAIFPWPMILSWFMRRKLLLPVRA